MAAGSESSRQQYKQAGREASEQPAVMESACSKETEEHSNILYYLQRNDHSGFFLDSRRRRFKPLAVSELFLA